MVEDTVYPAEPFYLVEARRIEFMFDFTKEEYENICKKAMLNDEMAKILEMKIKAYSITKMALELNMSESSVNRRIKQLKKKITKVL